jgi:hypothetical protein
LKKDGPWIPVRKDDSTFKFVNPGRSKKIEHVDIPIRDQENPFLDDEPSHAHVVQTYIDKYEHIPEQPMVYKQPVTKAQLYTEFNHTTDKDMRA